MPTLQADHCNQDGNVFLAHTQVALGSVLHAGHIILQVFFERGHHLSPQLQLQPPLLKAKRLHRVRAAARAQLGQQSSQGYRMGQRPALMTQQQYNRLLQQA